MLYILFSVGSLSLMFRLTRNIGKTQICSQIQAVISFLDIHPQLNTQLVNVELNYAESESIWLFFDSRLTSRSTLKSTLGAMRSKRLFYFLNDKNLFTSTRLLDSEKIRNHIHRSRHLFFLPIAPIRFVSSLKSSIFYTGTSPQRLLPFLPTSWLNPAQYDFLQK